MTTPACTVISTPSVASSWTSVLARLRCNGRITTQWVSTPSVADRSTPKNEATKKLWPCSYCSSYWRNTPAIAVAPSEKFSTPVPRKMTIRPCEANA